MGYQTKDTSALKMDIVGMQFTGVGEGTLSIQDIVPISGFSPYGVDLIKVWDAISRTYVSAYYFSETYEDDSYENELPAGWADIDQIRIELTLDPGQGFWITTASDATFTIAGQVVQKTDNKISTLSLKMDLVCNTFPASMSIQDIVPVSGFSPYGVDLIKVWDAISRTYVSAYYFSETYEDDSYENELPAGWADIDQIRIELTLDPGQGIWLTTASDAMAAFTPPAGL